jgi:hypothetical protein
MSKMDDVRRERMTDISKSYKHRKLVHRMHQFAQKESKPVMIYLKSLVLA